MAGLQITIRNIPSSLALENYIREKSEKLSRIYSRITSCRVVVDLPKKHLHRGKLYNAHIDITVPGKELVVTRKYNADVYVALRDAFNAIERQLEQHADKRHGCIKTHEEVKHGHVARLMLNEGYGFIEGVDGNEYYFSFTNIGNLQFDRLSVGDKVMYISQMLSEGLHAHHIIREEAASVA
jgi:ribosomal subunit interface protein